MYPWIVGWDQTKKELKNEAVFIIKIIKPVTKLQMTTYVALSLPDVQGTFIKTSLQVQYGDN